MARLELIVQPLGEAPKTVPVDRPLVVGRSRRADLTVDDEEVGREQFRIGLDETGAWLEAIGRTNQTLVDDQVVPAGMRRPLFDGTTIRVGRTRFTVRTNEATTDAPPPATAGPEMTMVARGPIGRMPPTETTPPADPTVDAGPLHTMPAPRPGAAPRGHDAAPKGPATPPKGPAKGPPPPAEPEQTMAFQSRPYRPGQAMPPSDTQPPAPPPPAPPPPPPPPKPKPAPNAPGRPTTVAVEPADIEKELGHDEPAAAPAAAARVQDGVPRLFVKCDGMKRRVRLMQARNALGRAESVDVQLPNDSVSELHAEITFDGTTWTLRDRGSTNGSFVDGAHLRGDSRALLRHSLIGLGNVRAVFLLDAANGAAADQRLERRAMRLLVQAGRLTPDAAREAVRIARADASQSIAEVLLMDTPLTAAEWATAVATARTQRSVLDLLADLLARLRPGSRKAPPGR